MDAAAADADVKLYKASTEILEELQYKLPLLVQSPKGEPRRWVIYGKAPEISRLIDSFQEWPQLLDPYSSELVNKLTTAFLQYCLSGSHAYCQDTSSSSVPLEPLPRAVCRLLYTFCKVRGHKIVVRLLNNEPRCIEPILKCFLKWNAQTDTRSLVSWEERYIMLLWLSHLMLAPFKLATISGLSAQNPHIPPVLDDIELPEVARTLLGLAFQHLYAPGKERESASRLIVRLALREDMQKLGLPTCIEKWCLAELRGSEGDQLNDQYRFVGLLTLLYGLANSSTSSEASQGLLSMFHVCREISTGTSPASIAGRSTAPARKLVIKLLRATIVHALALADLGHGILSEHIEGMLEEGVQILLELLADTDTPVRQAASKALSNVILKLGGDLAAEVIDAVLACLNENILLEDMRTGQLSAAVDLIDVDSTRYKRNVNAVNPLRWHGAMLTLSYTLFKRSPPPEQLKAILEALLTGLTFEQRSSVGTSLGVSVRDAACFGIWSLARKYTTHEVNAAYLQINMRRSRPASDQCTLQMIAIELVLASCLDPSGNLRRGASAALQELIGRHPDVIIKGIPVVQCVDYHAVARRANAVLEVAKSVSELDESYHTSLLYACLDWRGCKAVDAESRRQTANTIHALFSRARPRVRIDFVKELLTQIHDLKSSNLGMNAAARHGLLLSLAAVLRAFHESHQTSQDSVLKNGIQDISPMMSHFEDISGMLTGRMTADLVLVLEAVARVINEYATLSRILDTSHAWTDSNSTLMQALDRCVTASEDSTLATETAEANLSVFKLLTREQRVALCASWLPEALPGKKTAITCRGRLASIGKIFSLLSEDLETGIYQERSTQLLLSIVSSHIPIEVKVNAMESVLTILRDNQISCESYLDNLADAIQAGLNDYTMDQRGDIGSLLRMASINAFQSCAKGVFDIETTNRIVQAIVRLSAEKLIKVRYMAWMCLIRMDAMEIKAMPVRYEHQADVSSFEYYRQISTLLSVQSLRDGLLRGYQSAIAGGSEDISQTASEALISFLEDMGHGERVKQINSLTDTLVTQLESVKKREDREVVPVLDTICLIAEQFPSETAKDLIFKGNRLFGLLDELQTTVADIPRIQSIIRLLSCLSTVDDTRNATIDKITRKLLHKWPRVRQSAADAIFAIDKNALSIPADWNAAATVNKTHVVKARKSLGVGGNAAA